MTKREYIRQVTKRLRCSHAKKGEIARQLDSDIEIALGEGRKLEEILEEMGPPEALAGEFNENLGQAGKKKGKIYILLAVLAAALAAAAGVVYWIFPKASDINNSRIFDAAQVRARTEEVVGLVSGGDDETLDQYLTVEVREALQGATLDDIKQSVSGEWGKLRAIGSIYMMELSQMGRHYAMVQTNVTYENVSVVFTLTFDEEMQIYGLYMK